MKQFCKHHPHKVIDWVKSPKWSTDEILINVARVPESTNDYLIQFTDESPKKKYGWFYMDGKDIRRSPKQSNGTGQVYVVPMSKRQEWQPIKQCEHQI